MVELLRSAREMWGVYLVAGTRFIVHLALGNRYGFHRDELATLSDSLHLDWGYVAYPPLTPLLGRIGLELFGVAPLSVRWISALALAVVVVLTGAIARDLGASRTGQVLAAAVAAIAPVGMVQGVLFQYVSMDMLWWALLAWLVLQLVRTDEPRWWLPIGLVIGLGMLTKYTIALLVLGIVAGTLATPLRRHLRSRWLWIGAVLSLVVFAPNLIWQIQHDFISLEFLESIRERDVRIGRTDGFLIGQFMTAANVFTAPLWLAGAWFLLISTTGRRYTILGLMWLVPLVMFALMKGRAYYMAAAMPPLYAAGAVVWDSWMAASRTSVRRTLAAVTAVLLVAGAAVIGAAGLPIGRVNSALWHFARGMHDNFAEEIGWDDLVQNVAAVWESIPESERGRAGVLTGNYGEAGAILLLGRDAGLPVPISGVNSFWYRGYGNGPQIAVVVGIDRSSAESIFQQCRVAARSGNRFGVENEESRDHPEILLCRDPVAPWAEMWPYFRSFG